MPQASAHSVSATPFDIVINGGGMVGASLACALAQTTPYTVAVLEPTLPAELPDDAPFEVRMSAFSLGTVKLLENLNVWPHVTATGRACAYRHMRVWEDGGGETVFHAEQVGVPVLGYFAENRLIQQAALTRLAQLPSVTVRNDAPKSIRIADTGVTIHTHSGDTLHARLLLGADGANSVVRTAAGIGVHAWDYDHHALVTSALTTLPQQDTTWQRFTPRGPQAFLPFVGQRAALVWYESPRRCQELLELDEATFLRALEAEFPACLGGVTGLTSRVRFPLRRSHAHRYVGERVALIGDAAHTVHPLAGQGVNLGFLDAAALADVLHSAAEKGRDVGDAALLAEYERWRRADNLAMQTVIDLFYRVFSNDLPPVKLLRGLGLRVADRLGIAKGPVVRFALGTAGLSRTPSLLR